MGENVLPEPDPENSCPVIIRFSQWVMAITNDMES